jgi:hypothetical protein
MGDDHGVTAANRIGCLTGHGTGLEHKDIAFNQGQV